MKLNVIIGAKAGGVEGVATPLDVPDFEMDFFIAHIIICYYVQLEVADQQGVVLFLKLHTKPIISLIDIDEYYVIYIYIYTYIYIYMFSFINLRINYLIVFWL